MQEPLICCSFNPFDYSQIYLAATTGTIYLIDNLKSQSFPNNLVQKYMMNSNGSNPDLKTGQISDFKQLVMSSHTRNIAYFLLAREIIAYDTALNQVRLIVMFMK